MLTKHTLFLTKETPKALEKLTTGSQPLWGNMQAQQMVEHLIMSVRASMAISALENKPGTAMQQDFKEKFILSDAPLPKFIENPDHKGGLPALEFSSLKEASQKLVEKVLQFYEVYNVRSDAQTYNIFFGPLTAAELRAPACKTLHAPPYTVWCTKLLTKSILFF